MNATTRLSAKGQIVIPKDVRDAMGLAPGDRFEVVRYGQHIMLRRPDTRRQTITIGEATRRLREIIKYDGPPITDEMIDMAAASMANERQHRADADNPAAKDKNAAGKRAA